MLRALELTKFFGGLPVLQRAYIEFHPGEVHALMGENGAGKSTLLKMLAGLYQPDAGIIEWRGQPVLFPSPNAALSQGIAMVHQELMPIPDLTVAENLLLGMEPTNALGWVDRAEMQAQARRWLQELNTDLDPSRPMRSLSVAQMQVVEIAKALARQADVILMDEPTAALSDHEVSALFKAIATLRQRGVAVVYTTHKMDEVFRLADRISVLRDGQLVCTKAATEFTPASLIAHMVGRELSQVFPPVTTTPGEVILSVEQLTRAAAYRNISFTLRRGEVLGLAGLMGAGRTEVVSALYGLHAADGGTIRLHGKPVALTSPADGLAAGIGMLTEDRKGSGIIPALSVQHNLTLTALRQYCHGAVIDASAEAAVTQKATADFAIKASGPGQAIQQLSGGNQQKVLLARALLAAPAVLILDEPTRGIDIGAKAEIYALIGRLSAQGTAVLLVSSELPEILSLTHRILVLRQGELSAELDPRQTNQEEILRYAMPQ
jgi:ABC-type sugar transport system ATPase subunit